MSSESRSHVLVPRLLYGQKVLQGRGPFMWAGVEHLGTHLSILQLGLESLEHIVGDSRIYCVLVDSPQAYILLELPNGHVQDWRV